MNKKGVSQGYLFPRKRAKRKPVNIKGWLIIVVVFILMILIGSILEKNALVYINEVGEYKINSLVAMAVNNAISNGFDENISYRDIVSIRSDADGKISSIETDVVKLNRISAKISSEIQDKLLELDDQRIGIPAGVLLGNTILSGSGPSIMVKIKPYGIVETKFKSEFTSAGINQTRHRIYLQIKTKEKIVSPPIYEKTEVMTEIPFTESIIVGSVPEVYLSQQK